MNLLINIQQNQKLANDIKIEQAKQKRNEQIYNNARNISTFMTTSRDLSTDYTYMEQAFNSDGELIGLYKQWEVSLYVDESLEDNLDFILPFIKYEIVFMEGSTNNINYYNSHEDLHVSKFFELKENILLLKPSVYIKKTYGSDDFIIPQVKLRISLMNPTKFG